MIRYVTACFAACLAIATVAAPHAAAEDGFTGGVKFASHYAWQGGSESGEEAVIQGSLYYNFSSCYGGIWGSGTGDEYPGGIEIDLELGCGGSFTETLGWDVTLLLFTYPYEGGEDPATIAEARFKVSADLGLASVWARLGIPKWDQYAPGAANEDGHLRPNFGVTVPLGSDIPLSFSGTYGMDINRPNGDDYNWYHVSADTSFEGFGLSLFYSKRGERDDGTPAGDGIIGAAISRGF